MKRGPEKMTPEQEGYLRGLVWRARERIMNAGSLRDADVVRGYCQSFSESFAERFPELITVPGHCGGPGWWNEHWWCEDKNGKIIDPTAVQFGDGLRDYEPMSSGKIPYKVGRCPQCGADIYSDSEEATGGFCSEGCQKWFERDMEKELENRRLAAEARA